MCLFASKHQAGLVSEWIPMEVSIQAGVLSENTCTGIQGICECAYGSRESGCVNELNPDQMERIKQFWLSTLYDSE